MLQGGLSCLILFSINFHKQYEGNSVNNPPLKKPTHCNIKNGMRDIGYGFFEVVIARIGEIG